MIRKIIFASVSIMLFACYRGIKPTANVQEQAQTSKQQATLANELFLNYLNLEEMPDSIRNFQGEGADIYPVFLSSGYFRYQAEDSYFEMLAEMDKVQLRSCLEITSRLLRLKDSNKKGSYSWMAPKPHSRLRWLQSRTTDNRYEKGD